VSELPEHLSRAIRLDDLTPEQEAEMDKIIASAKEELRETKNEMKMQPGVYSSSSRLRAGSSVPQTSRSGIREVYSVYQGRAGKEWRAV
jgi:hypothetical protein